MIRRLAAAVSMAMAGACLAAPVAAAGGWATVGLSSLPDGIRAGEAWVVDLTLLQHGRTPLEGVHPSVTITRGGGEAARTFRATATDEPGVYRARVAFPSTGTWRYVVDDDFSARHAFRPVRVAPPGKGSAAALPAAVVTTGSGGGDDGGPEAALAAALAAGVIAAALVILVRRRRPDGGAKPAGG
jgi:hypothetical protein